MGTPSIVVVGSCNIDFQTFVPYLPKPGETLQADKLMIVNGGKGANQCVAVARLGASTAMVGRVGDDILGKTYCEDLKKDGVNIDFLEITKDTSTGTAIITVAKNGENQIIIVSGANGLVSPADIKKASSILQKASVVLFQFEIPLNTVVEALKLLEKGKVKSIVNAAPAVPQPDNLIFKLSDIFTLNETEAGILTGVPVNSVSDAEKAIEKLLRKGCNTVVLTLGAKGVVFASQTETKPVHVPAKKVTAIDTTGAGDAFTGAMAYYLAYYPNMPLLENITRCCEIAAVTVQIKGVQNSLPRRADLPKHLFENIKDS